MYKKYAALMLATTITAGCASVPQINMPTVSQAQPLTGRSVAYDVLYTQPLLGNPWTTPADEYYPPSSIQESLRLMGKHDAGTYGEAVLPTIPSVLTAHLGPQTFQKDVSKPSEYTLKVEIKADSKGGPIKAESNFLESLPMGILTLGFANSAYELLAEFNVKYTFLKGTTVVATKGYDVSDRSPSYWRSDERTEADYLYAKQLFKRNLDLTLTDFLSQLPPTL